MKGVLNGNLELQVEALEIISKAEIPFELDAEVNLDTYLDNLPYTLRSERSKNIFTVQSTIIEAFREALREEGFTSFKRPRWWAATPRGAPRRLRLTTTMTKRPILLHRHSFMDKS